MRPIEFELERTIPAPMDAVFARLVDIDGYNDWLVGTDSMLRRTRQTSPGPPRPGTTFVDETSQGTQDGQIVELQAPHTVVFHWWDTSRSGRRTFQGWPGYRLEPLGDNETLVRHRGRLLAYGVWQLGKPLWRRLAIRERTRVVDALAASFRGVPEPG